MEKQNLLLGYIRQHLPVLAAFLMFAGIFAAVFYLYDLPAEAVLYAAGLSTIAGGVLFVVSFLRFRRRRLALCRIAQDIELLADRLPESSGPLEEIYWEMVRRLRELDACHLTQWQTQRAESIDYYTTWVHQIKTPISVMRMILQGEDTPEHKELLSELFRVEQYVEMVLCYFRLDSSSTDFVFREYSLDDIIKQAVRKYASQFVRKRIRLIYEGTSLSVLTDEKWLGFIIEQLLSNAIKYTEKGSVTIEVHADRTLTVTDTGIGIASEDLPRIFEKGFTGYNGRANKKSTGLGLYLCKQAADRLSHKLSAYSVVGKGTTITVDLRTVALEVE